MKRIGSLAGLMRAVRDRKAVTCPKSHAFRGPIAAAWVVNLQGTIIHMLIENGLFIYEPKK
jgi:hypothetical protein